MNSTLPGFAPDHPFSSLASVGSSVLNSVAFLIISLILTSLLILRSYASGVFDVARSYPRVVALVFLTSAILFSLLLMAISLFVFSSSAELSIRSSFSFAGVMMLFGPQFVFTPLRQIELKKKTIFKAMVTVAHKEGSRRVSVLVFLLLTLGQCFVCYSLFELMDAAGAAIEQTISVLVGYVLIGVFYLIVYAAAMLKKPFVIDGIDIVDHLRRHARIWLPTGKQLHFLQTKGWTVFYIIWSIFTITAALGLTIYVAYEEITNFSTIGVGNRRVPEMVTKVLSILFSVLSALAALACTSFVLVAAFRPLPLAPLGENADETAARADSLVEAAVAIDMRALASGEKGTVGPSPDFISQIYALFDAPNPEHETSSEKAGGSVTALKNRMAARAPPTVVMAKAVNGLLEGREKKAINCDTDHSDTHDFDWGCLHQQNVEARILLLATDFSLQPHACYRLLIAYQAVLSGNRYREAFNTVLSLFSDAQSVHEFDEQQDAAALLEEEKMAGRLTAGPASLKQQSFDASEMSGGDIAMSSMSMDASSLEMGGAANSSSVVSLELGEDDLVVAEDEGKRQRKKKAGGKDKKEKEKRRSVGRREQSGMSESSLGGKQEAVSDGYGKLPMAPESSKMSAETMSSTYAAVPTKEVSESSDQQSATYGAVPTKKGRARRSSGRRSMAQSAEAKADFESLLSAEEDQIMEEEKEAQVYEERARASSRGAGGAGGGGGGGGGGGAGRGRGGARGGAGRGGGKLGASKPKPASAPSASTSSSSVSPRRAVAPAPAAAPGGPAPPSRKAAAVSPLAPAPSAAPESSSISASASALSVADLSPSEMKKSSVALDFDESIAAPKKKSKMSLFKPSSKSKKSLARQASSSKADLGGLEETVNLSVAREAEEEEEEEEKAEEDDSDDDDFRANLSVLRKEADSDDSSGSFSSSERTLADALAASSTRPNAAEAAALCRSIAKAADAASISKLTDRMIIIDENSWTFRRLNLNISVTGDKTDAAEYVSVLFFRLISEVALTAAEIVSKSFSDTEELFFQKCLKEKTPLSSFI